MLRIEPIEKDLLPQIRNLLIACDLPVSDIRSQTLFLAAIEDQELIGCIGMEKYGEIGLLRSLAVSEKHRSRGVGKQLCEVLLQTMGQEDIRVVYLLTTSAAGFFEKMGFERLPRSLAPEVIQKTEQFQSLCPSSAVVMRKYLIRQLSEPVIE